MMEKLKRRCEKIGINFNKELLLTAVISLTLVVVGLILFLALKNKLLLITTLGCSLINVLLLFFRISKKEQRNKNNNMDDFIHYFSYFRIFILNRESVYASLNKTLEYSSESIRPWLQKLIDDIDQDKSIKPFISFASCFEEKIVEQIMISIYEMIDNGNDINYINQFSSMFENFKNRNAAEQETKRIEKFDSFLNTSLLGSGVIMIILVFGIVNLVGEIL